MAASETYNVKLKVEGLNQINQAKSALGGLGTAVKVAAGAFAAIGTTKLVRGFVDVGREVESLGLRFKFLFGSAEEGAKAFDVLNEFAAKVPFSLDEISAASGNLAVVADDADELSDILGIVGNVAAVTGLDFQTTAEQIQRAFSGGIASADIFRERGVRALLGFKEGAKVTVEETRAAFFKFFANGGEFSTATDEFAGTLDGTISMLNDKFRKFQEAAASEFFDTLKDEFGDLNKFLTENEGKIKQFGANIGEFLADAVVVVSDAVKFVNENLETFQRALKAIIVVGAIKFMYDLAKAIKVLTLAMAANPIGAIAVGIAALGTAAYTFFPQIKDFMIGLTGIGEEAKKAKEENDELIKSMEGYKDKIMLVAEEQEKQAKAQEAYMKKQEEQMAAFQKSQAEILEFNKKYAKELEKLEASVLDLEESYDPLLAAENKRKEEMALLDEALKKGIITQERYKKIVESMVEEIEEAPEPIKKYQRSIEGLSEAFKDRFKEMDEAFDPIVEAVDLSVSAFQTFKQGVGDAFADAILGAKSFTQSLQEVARAILRQLISGLIQIGLEVFVFDILREKMIKVRDEQNKLNSALGIELGLRTALAFFTGGGSLFAGFFADGGKIPAGKFGITGESGPELVGGPATVTPLAAPSTQMAAAGDVNINFNITTVDAESFDDLLVSRRGTITSIINDGLERQGRTALI